jgi:rRNA-processing protein FCF1
MATNRSRNSKSLKPKRGVLLDTNFLFIPHRHKIDIFKEIEDLLTPNLNFYLLEANIKELDYMKEKAYPSLLKEIEFAENLTEKCIILKTEREDSPTDDLILQMALEKDIPVATNDKELRKRLKKERIPVIFLRQTSYLELEGKS